MLIVGDKIKQVKDIVGFGKAGDEYLITHIDRDGNITFKSNLRSGIMSYSDFKKYFEVKIDDNKSENAKSEYGEYKICTTYDPVKEEIVNCEVADKGESLKVKLYIPSEFTICNIGPIYRIGVATCSPKDKFDKGKGIDIAYARAMIKIWKAILGFETNK